MHLDSKADPLGLAGFSSGSPLGPRGTYSGPLAILGWTPELPGTSSEPEQDATWLLLVPRRCHLGPISGIVWLARLLQAGRKP